jgi:NAD(P)-dependent dehydrogenase (short-subunit alcohol dehydrogenase family)
MGAFDGKVATVTGAGGGIGRAIAVALAVEGAALVVNDAGVTVDGRGQNTDPADSVVEEIRMQGFQAVANYDSVATADGGERVVKAALDSYDRIDILVNCAGIVRDRMIFNMSEEEWDTVLAVHLKGTFGCTRPAAMMMRQQRSGRIINVTSESGLVGNAGQANYGAAKSGIAGFTRVVARDMGRYGVTCNAIAPRAWTRMTAGVPEGASRPDVYVHSPFPQAEEMRTYAPEDIAPFACFLATSEAQDINGQIFLVYGGVVALLNQPVAWRTVFTPGTWTVDELMEAVPLLLEGTANPAPPAGNIHAPAGAGVGKEVSVAEEA